MDRNIDLPMDKNIDRIKVVYSWIFSDSAKAEPTLEVVAVSYTHLTLPTKRIV